MFTGIILAIGKISAIERKSGDFRLTIDTGKLPLADVLARREGVCQDFAHLAIGCLRSQGLAARYVSGYIETDPPPGKEKLVGADASHAWFSIFQPGSGWLDFDPTNNLLGGNTLIRVKTSVGEVYADTAGPDTPLISWSTAKAVR